MMTSRQGKKRAGGHLPVTAREDLVLLPAPRYMLSVPAGMTAVKCSPVIRSVLVGIHDYDSVPEVQEPLDSHLRLAARLAARA